jgi:hypothetical protein
MRLFSGDQIDRTAIDFSGFKSELPILDKLIAKAKEMARFTGYRGIPAATQA